jgi:hypothetical protein
MAKKKQSKGRITITVESANGGKSVMGMIELAEYDGLLDKAGALADMVQSCRQVLKERGS